jgi:hypothetical protein
MLEAQLQRSSVHQAAWSKVSYTARRLAWYGTSFGTKNNGGFKSLRADALGFFSGKP